MITNIKDQLKRDEGVRPVPYKDTLGFNTVGVGHNLDANPLPNEVYPLSIQRMDEILEQDLSRITSKLVADLPWVGKLQDVYLGVLQNMAFNLGAKGLEGFHHMLVFIQSGDYRAAAIEGANSSWYTQVGNRAKRLMAQLKYGVWQ